MNHIFKFNVVLIAAQRHTRSIHHGGNTFYISTNIFRDDVEPRDEHCQPSFTEDCDRGNEEFDRPTCTSLQLAAISGNRESVENWHSLENSFGR